jgi:multiple antibiotic resistance protein
MPQHFLYSFVTLFVIIDPVGSAAVFVGLMQGMPRQLRSACALRGIIIATLLLLVFALVGDRLLTALGITIPAFRIAGGILLFLLATEMVFARESGIRRPTAPEEREIEHHRTDIAVFPLAFPLLAGPGALTSIVLLMGRAASPLAAAGVIAALALVMVLTLASLMAATQVVRLLGVTGVNVVSRVLGVILAALATQLVLDGLSDSVLRRF